MRYVPLQGKTFGEKCMEPIAREYFNLESRNDSGYRSCKKWKKTRAKICKMAWKW